MKAAVVTFARAYNYGAVLQCYALSKKLRDLGIEVEVLDYYPKYFKDQYNFSYLGKLRLLPFRPFKSWKKYAPVYLVLKRRNLGFESFIKKNIPMTSKQYTTIDEINKEIFSFDSYISGSDQVWSNECVPFDPVYFLDFDSVKGKKRYSYAASFGFSKLPDGFEEEYKRRLTGWDAYSVREDSGIKILSDLLGVQATKCCDPTLLLTKEQWNDVRKKRVKRKPYILLYSVWTCKELFEYAKELSQRKKMKVIYLCSAMRHEKMMGYEEKEYGVCPFGSASPSEWLGLFAEAEYVLTDSFHGTVFSIINHKKFMTLTELSIGKKNGRAIELMNALKIEGRNLPGDLNSIDEDIDWTEIDKRVQKIRDESMVYLNTVRSEREN